MTHSLRTATVAIASLVLLTAGCSSDGSDPVAAPTETASETASETAPSETAPTEQVTEDPITFGSMGGVSCTEVRGDLLMTDQFEVLRPVTLSGLDLPETTGIDVGDITLTRMRKGDLSQSGSWVGDEPADDRKEGLRWAQREPLADTQVKPGWYRYFLPLEVDYGAKFRGVELTWEDTSGSGSSRQTANEAFRKVCR